MRVGTVTDAFLLLFDHPGHPRAPCPGRRGAGSGVLPKRLVVVVLAMALLTVVTSAARATVRRSSGQGVADDTPSFCPGVDLEPTNQDLGLIRTATLCLVNRERASHGERPLARNQRLEQAAQRHTEGMALGDYVKHVGPGGDTPLARMRAAGYISRSQIPYEVGENIGWGTLWESTPRAIVAAWMTSPGHRANILDARFRDTAVGVSPYSSSPLAPGQAGAIYTQDFGSL